jgi:GNAT superfamily N-acetyltransferase/quinol monooxygenase YgiN
MRIDWYEGERSLLRALFELADDSSDQIDRYLQLGRILVVREGDEIVGHLQLLPTGRGATEIKSLAVRDDHRGRGIGSRLVALALTVCRSEDVRVVTVRTATVDVGTIRFYQRCGFRAAAIERDAFTAAKGYRPGLEADGIPVRDAVRFTLKLGRSAPEQGRLSGRDDAGKDTRKGEPMVTKGLIVRIESKAGREDDVAAFLRDAAELVEDEPATVAWFAVATGPRSFAIVDVFPDEAGRQAHLEGPVAAALVEQSHELLAGPPVIERADVLAEKLP